MRDEKQNTEKIVIVRSGAREFGCVCQACIYASTKAPEGGTCREEDLLVSSLSSTGIQESDDVCD